MTQIEPQPAVNPGLEAAIAGKTQRKVRSAKIQLEGVASSPASSNENHLPLVLHCFHLLLRLVDVWYLQALQAIFLNANKSQIKSEGPFRPQVLASSTNNTLPMENAKRQRLAGSAWVAFDADPCNALASAGSPASVALEHLHFQRLNRKSFDARCSQGAIQEQQNVRWTRS